MVYAARYERFFARSYDALYAAIRDPAGDVAFYAEQARQSGGPVLEFGCGTGRILLPTARSGVSCVGVDASTEMLAAPREKMPPANVQLVHGRMQDVSVGAAQFGLVTIPFRAFQHLLTVDEQLATLDNVRRHLAPQGRLVFDLFDPKLDRMSLVEEPEREGVAVVLDGKRVVRWERVQRDLSRQVMTVRFRFESDAEELRGETELEMRWFYRYEVEHLLARAGFGNVEFYRDFHGTTWSAGEEIVVVARPE